MILYERSDPDISAVDPCRLQSACPCAFRYPVHGYYAVQQARIRNGVDALYSFYDRHHNSRAQRSPKALHAIYVGLSFDVLANRVLDRIMLR